MEIEKVLFHAVNNYEK